MTFAFPWALAGLAVVAAAAVLALLRPARRRLTVPSLLLWREAAARTTRPARRHKAAAALAWLLLLAGATAAVLAAARPVLSRQAARRHLAVGVLSSAELASPDSQRALAGACAALLGRLAPPDRVQLLLPEAAGGASDPLSPADARRRLERLEMLPARADELKLSEPSVPVDREVVFVPAGADAGAAGPRRTVIELPAWVGEVSIETAAAETVSEDRTQLFLAVRNHTEGARTAAVRETVANGAAIASPLRRMFELSPGERRGVVRALPAAEGIAVQLEDGGGGNPFGAAAYLARRARPVTAVAIVGRDDPSLRRFVEAADWLEPVASVGEADVAIANQVEPPEGVPSLVVAPPSPPPACRAGKLRQDVRLGEADVLADDPIMRHVDFRGVAVRRLRGWTAPPRGHVPLATLNGEAIILRDAGGVAAGPPHVYVAFSIEPENTNLSLSESYVLFLAGAMEYLAGREGTLGGYGSLTPLEAGRGTDWQPVLAGGTHASGLPLPGLYADSDGALHAVSLNGLGGGRPARDPVAAAREAPLPEPTAAQARRELWPGLALAALACWLAGWALRRLAL
jgi:hypothetical protein